MPMDGQGDPQMFAGPKYIRYLNYSHFPKCSQVKLLPNKINHNKSIKVCIFTMEIYLWYFLKKTTMFPTHSGS